MQCHKLRSKQQWLLNTMYRRCSVGYLLIILRDVNQNQSFRFEIFTKPKEFSALPNSLLISRYWEIHYIENLSPANYYCLGKNKKVLQPSSFYCLVLTSTNCLSLEPQNTVMESTSEFQCKQQLVFRFEFCHGTLPCEYALKNDAQIKCR